MYKMNVLSKKKLVILGLALVSFQGFSQQTKGRVSYDIVMSSDDPQTSGYIGQMENSTMELYFFEDKIRSEMYMGDFMTNINVIHKDEDTSLMLLDGMMGKLAMKNTLDDLEDEQRLALTERTVDLVEGEKEIMGYTCKKAIITTPDENESVVWYTTEIVPEFRAGQYLFEEIPGVPLQMESTWGNIDMVYTAFEFKKKIKKPDVLFSMEIPKGYTLRTAEEMKQMRRGGGQ